MKIYKFDQSKNLSSMVSIFIITVMSVVAVWVCLRTAQKVIDSAPNSSAFNIQKRAIENKLR